MASKINNFKDLSGEIKSLIYFRMLEMIMRKELVGCKE